MGQGNLRVEDDSQVFVTASIVLYNSAEDEIIRIIESLFNSQTAIKLYLIDNSLTDKISNLLNRYKNIVYTHNPNNPGFGAAHNIAISKAIVDGSKFHFVVNPDVYFHEDPITLMVEHMLNHKNVGMMMPEILNEDSTIQTLPKLLPSPLSIILRKIKRPEFLYKRFINRYELRFVDRNLVYNSPILSGCFTLLNLKVIKEVGPYDDRFFMYFEDWDLSRRVHEKFETLYFPNVRVYHGYASGANKNSRLFKIFVKSAVLYFNKWGWFFDRKRQIVNRETLNQFR